MEIVPWPQIPWRHGTLCICRWSLSSIAVRHTNDCCSCIDFKLPSERIHNGKIRFDSTYCQFRSYYEMLKTEVLYWCVCGCCTILFFFVVFSLLSCIAFYRWWWIKDEYRLLVTQCAAFCIRVPCALSKFARVQFTVLRNPVTTPIPYLNPTVRASSDYTVHNQGNLTSAWYQRPTWFVLWLPQRDRCYKGRLSTSQKVQIYSWLAISEFVEIRDFANWNKAFVKQGNWRQQALAQVRCRPLVGQFEYTSLFQINDAPRCADLSIPSPPIPATDHCMQTPRHP